MQPLIRIVGRILKWHLNVPRAIAVVVVLFSGPWALVVIDMEGARRSLIKMELAKSATVMTIRPFLADIGKWGNALSPLLALFLGWLLIRRAKTTVGRILCIALGFVAWAFISYFAYTLMRWSYPDIPVGSLGTLH